jgi:hypothetical protein
MAINDNEIHDAVSFSINPFCRAQMRLIRFIPHAIII